MKTTATSSLHPDMPGLKHCFGCPLKTSYGSDLLVLSRTEDFQAQVNTLRIPTERMVQVQKGGLAPDGRGKESFKR